MSKEKLTPYDTVAGCLEGKQPEDKVLFESDFYYVCQRGEEKLFFHKWFVEEDDGVNEYLCRLNSYIVPCGILNIIDDLLEYKSKYEKLRDEEFNK